MWKSTRFRCSNACIALRTDVRLSDINRRKSGAALGGGLKGARNGNKIVHVMKRVIK